MPRRFPIVVLLLASFAASCDVSADAEGRFDARVRGDGDGGADAAAGDAGPAAVCEPGSAVCEGLRRKVCGPRGDGWAVADCPPGAGCVEGACEIAHPRLVFVFDTSSSMLAAATAGGGFAPPECGSIEQPGSRIAESKALFAQLFAAALPTVPRMGLMRFPQRAAGAPECDAALYSGASQLPGDDGSHAVPWERGSWFRSSLRQVVVVPLTAAEGDDGREALTTWLDGVEDVRQANQECTADGECTAGFCSGGSCWRYLEPELRAAGGTPLGKTLFYAGEYYRHAVLIDGVECTHDAECGSPGYRCGAAGVCEDPLRSCRSNHIVVFSDGEETAHPEPDDFFNPLVQARRLRHGLGCATDGDCLADAACVAGSCRPPGDPPPAFLARPDRDPAAADTLETLLATTDPLGVQRLETADGQPASVQVHALDVWGNPGNELLAWLGGGEYVFGTLTDSEAVLYAMDLLLRSKGAETICR